jgi:hypothetical protein
MIEHHSKDEKQELQLTYPSNMHQASSAERKYNFEKQVFFSRVGYFKLRNASSQNARQLTAVFLHLWKEKVGLSYPLCN